MADFINIHFKVGKETQYGKLYKGYIKIDELIEQLNKLKENGQYVNFILGFNKEKDLHYMKIDYWKPEKKENDSEQIVKFGEEEIPF